MKTAVSIPDEIYTKAESFARRARKSRSRVYSEALAEYLARRTPETVTAALDAVCAEVDNRPDRFVREASRRALQRSEW
jgi:antitoxin MazE6